MKIFRPEDFGAKGDGVSNDAFAFSQALAAAKAGGTVLLGANRSYYFAPTAGASAAAIDLDGAKNITIRGDNTTLLIDRPLYYCNLRNSQNVTLSGLTFDYRVRPFALGRAISICEETRSALMQMDRSLWIDQRAKSEFAVLQKPDGRYHLFLDFIEPVDAENWIYRIVFRDDTLTRKRIPMLLDTALIVPLPGFGHTVERAFSITGNRDVTVENCRVYSGARFGFALFCNEGKMTFRRLTVCPAPGEPAQISFWRDCFHVKENRATFLWQECFVSHCYDDVFNISASTLFVKEVNGKEIDLFWLETGKSYPGVAAGDVISFIDTANGRDFGTARIAEVIWQKEGHNRFLLEEEVPDLYAAESVKAHVLTLASPGSVIENCDFRGTFRFRSPIEIRNSHFYVARMWIDMALPLEGPVPEHIHFTDCDFTCDDAKSPYFHIVSQREGATAPRQYRIRDLVFRNCTLPRACFDIAESDREGVAFLD